MRLYHNWNFWNLLVSNISAKVTTKDSCFRDSYLKSDLTIDVIESNPRLALTEKNSYQIWLESLNNNNLY